MAREPSGRDLDQRRRRWPTARRRPAGAGGPAPRPLLDQAGPIAVMTSLAALVLVGIDARGDDRTRTTAPSAAGTAVTSVSIDPAPADGDADGSTVSTVSTRRSSTTTSQANPGKGSRAVTTAPVTPRGEGSSTATFDAGAACVDATGEADTAAVAALDLKAVTVRRDSNALLVRFETAGPIADAGGAGRPPAEIGTWQVTVADGDDVLHTLTVIRIGNSWESEFIDFADPANDTHSSFAPPKAAVVEVRVPADRLGNLPAEFTWWASTSGDVETDDGTFAGDACPDAAWLSEFDLFLPDASVRVRFPG